MRRRHWEGQLHHEAFVIDCATEDLADASVPRDRREAGLATLKHRRSRRPESAS
jgi:hypothetical protein